LKTKLVAIAAAAVAIIPLTSSPAAAAAAAGKVSFSCVAALPAFPSPSANGTCGSGTLGTGPVVPSSAWGTIAGLTDENNAFVVTAAGTNNFSAEFSYREPCVAGEPPVTGEANGTARITGWNGRVVKQNGTVETVTDGVLEVHFSWTRVGGTAAITIDWANLTLPGSSDHVTDPATGVGQASFAPVLTAANLCPVGGPLKAAVTGSAIVVFTP
jgi:hypothetical protein